MGSDSNQANTSPASEVALSTITQTVAKLLAPESLAIDRDQLNDDEVLAQPRMHSIQPGDFILVNTPGSIYKFFRRITNHRFDHVAAVVSNGKVLHIGPAKIRLLPAERLLSKQRNPVVLRPKLSKQEQQEFVEHLESFVGKEYDLLKVYSVIARLTIKRYFGVEMPASLSSPDEGPALICSEALLQALRQTSPTFSETLDRMELDHTIMGAASITDFMTIHYERPDLFSEVPLPVVEEHTEQNNPKRRRRELEEFYILRTTIALTRSTLLHLMPSLLKPHVSSLLNYLDTLPPVTVIFIQLALLYLIYRRYPLPVLLSFLPRSKM